MDSECNLINISLKERGYSSAKETGVTQSLVTDPF